MGRGRSDAGRSGPGRRSSADAGGDEPRRSFLGGVSRLAAQVHGGARRVKDAAQDLRSSPALQHALAARERGNLEAAFWLLGEAFGHAPEDPSVALHYWDAALALGRVKIASAAGVKLVEARAAAGDHELAAQHWLELVKGAPDVLVSPAALAVILPALAERVASAQDGGSDDPETMAGHLRRAVRHAVDPRNSELHPGVAMRIFEVGRDINPEASRRAAEAALESPHLHEAKRQRLVDWLAGRPIEGATSDDAPARASASPVADAPARQTSGVPARRPSAVPVPPANGKVVAQAPRADGPAGGPRIAASVLVGLDEDGLTLKGTGPGRLDWTDVQAVSVAELGGIATHPVIVIDLVSNWTRRGEERLEIVRLRVDELDLATLISRENAVGSDLASLLGDILERTRAVPLPDPESALGMRIARFETPEDYAREALRVGA